MGNMNIWKERANSICNNALVAIVKKYYYPREWAWAVSIEGSNLQAAIVGCETQRVWAMI